MRYIPNMSLRSQKERIKTLLAVLYLFPWLFILFIIAGMGFPVFFWLSLVTICLYQIHVLYQCGQLRDVFAAIFGIVYLILFFIPYTLPLHPLGYLFAAKNLIAGIGGSFSGIAQKSTVWKVIYLIPTLLYNAAFWLGWFMGAKEADRANGANSVPGTSSRKYHVS